MGKRGPPKGIEKTPGSGRVAGTPNKKTQTLIEKCELKGLDIWEAMIELAEAAQGIDRFKMLSEMAQYVFPKRKAIEHSGETKQRQVLEIKKHDGSGIRIEEKDDE